MEPVLRKVVPVTGLPRGVLAGREEGAEAVGSGPLEEPEAAGEADAEDGDGDLKLGPDGEFDAVSCPIDVSTI